MDEWREWYTNLMPDWRAEGLPAKKKWPLRRHVPDGEEWLGIRKGERNGAFLLLLSLSWWKGRTTDGSDERDEYASALEDLTWLLSLLAKHKPPLGSQAAPGDSSRKRKTPNGEETMASSYEGRKRMKENTGAGPETTNTVPRSLRSARSGESTALNGRTRCSVRR